MAAALNAMRRCTSCDSAATTVFLAGHLVAVPLASWLREAPAGATSDAGLRWTDSLPWKPIGLGSGAALGTLAGTYAAQKL